MKCINCGVVLHTNDKICDKCKVEIKEVIEVRKKNIVKFAIGMVVCFAIGSPILFHVLTCDIEDQIHRLAFGCLAVFVAAPLVAISIMLFMRIQKRLYKLAKLYQKIR